MKNLHKILFLEDEPQDVELMVHELKEAGFENIPSKRVSSKKEFLNALDEFNPDVIIADYSLPMFNGMHAFRLFKEKKLKVPFILVTGALNEEAALECLNEGVDDVLIKDNFKRLPTAVLRALQLKSVQREKDEMTFALQSQEEVMQKLKAEVEKAKLHDLLSEREYEILILIAKGKSIKEIAGDLFISPATVATYRSRLLEKMNLKSNVEITQYAIRNKIID